MSNAVYPYRIDFKRTPKWWDTDWRDISNWCNQSFGEGNWNYYGDSFVFENEGHLMLFKLRWL